MISKELESTVYGLLVGSAVLVTTLTDILGFLMLLGFAALLVTRLG